jgi:hypothetical protein
MVANPSPGKQNPCDYYRNARPMPQSTMDNTQSLVTGYPMLTAPGRHGSINLVHTNTESFPHEHGKAKRIRAPSKADCSPACSLA